jgi:predicted  nucleic acid-binding Zn-ribbon protein
MMSRMFNTPRGLKDGDPLYLNQYRCPNCGNEWDDVWDCGCDDECAACGTKNISPVESEQIRLSAAERKASV